jgi:cholesterol transport system auxiliary component
MNTRTLILAALLAAPLSGCISFGAKPPPSLLNLSSTTGLAVGETQKSSAAATITIGVPAVSQELASNRVPVHSGGTAIAYVKDAQWVEPPSRLFARLLSDTITAQTGRVVLSYRQSRLDPGAQLTGELRTFGIEEETSEAVVTFDAALLRGADPVFEKRRFEARVPVAKIDSENVGPALNQAANKVAAEIADWVGK